MGFSCRNLQTIPEKHQVTCALHDTSYSGVMFTAVQYRGEGRAQKRESDQKRRADQHNKALVAPCKTRPRSILWWQCNSTALRGRGGYTYRGRARLPRAVVSRPEPGVRCGVRRMVISCPVGRGGWGQENFDGVS